MSTFRTLFVSALFASAALAASAQTPPAASASMPMGGAMMSHDCAKPMAKHDHGAERGTPRSAPKSGPCAPGMGAMAPTIACDDGGVGRERGVPVALAANVAVPTLVIDGGASAKTMPYMRATADKLGATIPNAKRRTIEGQAHDVSPAAIVPVLIEFFQ